MRTLPYPRRPQGAGIRAAVLIPLAIAALTPTLLAVLPPTPAWAQQQQTASAAVPVRAAAKKPITHDVYDKWKSIQGTTLSRNGEWAAYALSSYEADPELIVRNLKSGAEKRYPRGRNARITSDSRYLLYTVEPAKADVEKAKGKPAAEQPKGALAIVELATGKQDTIERVRRFAVAEKGPRYVAYIQDPEPPKPAAPAARPAAGEASAPPASAAKPDDAADAAAQQGQGRRRQGGGAGGAAGAAQGGPGAAAGTRTPAPPAAPADLVVRDLTTGQAVLSVSAPDTFLWNEDGSRLLYATSPRNAEEKAVSVREMAGGKTATLVSGRGTYKSFAFNEKGDAVAFLADRAVKDEAAKPEEKPATAAASPAAAAPPEPDEDRLQQRRPLPGRGGAPGQGVAGTPGAAAATPPGPSATYAVWLWRAGEDKASEVVTAKTAGMPAGFVVSDNDGSLRFSEDGARLYCAYKPAPKPRAKDAPTPINVDIWASNDDLLQPMQKVRATQEARRDYAAAFNLRDRRFVPLATPDMPDVNADSDAKRVTIGGDDRKYRKLVSWDTSYRDVYLVDLGSGKRRLLQEKHSGPMSLSPGEKYLLYWDGAAQAWFARNLDGDKPAVNLTGAIKGVAFADETWDTPGPASAYGTAGWTDGDGSVLIYDRFDIWQVSPENKFAPRRLTSGRAGEKVYRYTRLDPEERVVPTDKPLLLSLTDDRTKATGYARLAGIGTSPTAPAPALETLVSLDKRMAGLQKAEDADTVLFTLSRFDEYPDLWTATLGDLKKMTRLSDANPQQKEYNWGTAELISYKSADGVPLRGILNKPENFDPSKKYPLLVYIYETLSDGLHQYTPPSAGTSINVSRYVSNGYLVLRPDIVYKTGYPGESALKCVLPAIEKVVDRGYVDEKRIGIQGHSWGGYQITHLVTRTNRFAAAEAGASVSNMVSAYGGIRWQTGMSRQFQYERTQSRIGGTPWDKTREFLENSPIFWADKVTTPYLTLHNDEDGAVPWEQGIEFVTALRRLGREAYLFNYNGEGHGLTNRDNQRHWTVHMAEFFDHYLLGAPRPEWMEKGVPYLDRGTRDLSAFYGKKPSAAEQTAAEKSEKPATAAAAGAGGESAEPRPLPPGAGQ